MIDSLISKGFLPDFIIRKGIRNFLTQRVQEITEGDADLQDKRRRALIKELRNSPIAIETNLANDQHYQVPTAFFKEVLGTNMKYSCSYYDETVTSLKDAEDAMLKLTCSRADLQDGQRILELGCGWGAITLYMAKNFPNSKITAVSNSKTQREHIMARAKELELDNVEVLTCNVAKLKMPEGEFDRVVSVEMFEHMRNYQELLKGISTWLKDDGKLFVHIFVHNNSPYKFEVRDESDWMAKYFFSGGIMPSEHLLYYFQDDLKITNHWSLSGTHYAKTSRDWLNNMDKNKEKIMQIFENHYGEREAKRWFHYWRVFFMSCEELWAYKNGREWLVGHYLFEK